MKRFLTSVLAVLLINFLFAPFAPAQTADKDARSAAKVKARIMSLGTGPTARVATKLRDGVTVGGYVFEAGEDHFTIVEESSGAKRDVGYAQVKQVKVREVNQVRRNNLSKGANKVVAVAVGVVAVLTVLFFVGLHDR